MNGKWRGIQETPVVCLVTDSERVTGLLRCVGVGPSQFAADANMRRQIIVPQGLTKSASVPHTM